MKKKLVAITLAAATALSLAACGSTDSASTASTAAASETASTAASETASSEAASGKTYKVGIVQYVDDASLNQIEQNIEAELDKCLAE